ncbi:5'-AMP-activated protein kinase beta subunit, interation domain-containing protein, partial [Boeremia exigua]|uniref:5'-AMP-activated protein kinase beta subunit, interation domain-containing protein n=1 Tax=Boeremia exigua TaxID=749465 RepID=UPI001E8DBEA7
MGNEQSSHKSRKDRDGHDRASRQATPQPTPAAAAQPPPPAPAATPPPSEAHAIPLDAPSDAHPIAAVPAVPATPAAAQAIPAAHAIPIDAPRARAEVAIAGSLEPADASDYIVPSSHFSRPPRLPLPIEEELHTPGSPIIAPTGIGPETLDHGEVEGVLPRRTSMLSSTTADDDDLGEEFKVPTPGRPTVPTLVEWEGAGDRVYVTGTFAGWNRKYRLHQNGPSKKENVLSAYVPIHPGTHHLMFIVDNDMMISDKLPTAVDYTNILVNYLEVSYDDIKDQQAAGAAAKPADTPASTDDQPAAQPPQDPPSSQVPLVKPPGAEIPNTKLPEPEKRYHSKIPAYLLDLDAPDESSRFARANAATGNFPTPPSLPMFLSKSILNGTTPMKDDSSVLIMPNHTVLNHLATSSIKDNILATSATTRYKQKFLTTIMYKPKEEHGEVY